MFFLESDRTAREHPDLAWVVEQVDRHLSGVCSSSPLRPSDFSCVIGAEANQVDSVFDLLARRNVLLKEEMVECDHCQNLMSADAFRQAFEDEDPFECTGCGGAFSRRAKPTVIYRLSDEALKRTRASAKPRHDIIREIFGSKESEEPLGDRAQNVLIAMLELSAVDSDSRRSTEDIATKAINGDGNALKSVMADLKTRLLIDSKTGRGGGCWLTQPGRERAQKLRGRIGHSATV